MTAYAQAPFQPPPTPARLVVETLHGVTLTDRFRFGTFAIHVLPQHGISTRQTEAVESTKLLQSVMGAIDVAVFAFDGDEHIRLANRAAAALLRRHPDSLVGLSAVEAGIDSLLEGPPVSSESHTFPGRAGRWPSRTSSSTTRWAKR